MADVLTTHNCVIKVDQNSKIISAIMDGQWDMIKQQRSPDRLSYHRRRHSRNRAIDRILYPFLKYFYTSGKRSVFNISIAIDKFAFIREIIYISNMKSYIECLSHDRG